MAPPKRAYSAQDHWQRLEVETPEHVVIDYELAGFGTRLLAAALDSAVQAALIFCVGLLVVTLGGNQTMAGLLLAFGFVTIYWGYYAFFEGRYRGQTPGKKWMGIRVVRDTGHPIGVSEAVLRNLLRVVDALPPPYLLGLGMIAFHPRAKRLGDIVAGTVVVRDRPVATVTTPVRAAPETAASLDLAGAPRLSDAEFRVVEEFLTRASALDADVAQRFADRLVGRFAEHVRSGSSGLSAIQELYVDELGRRRSRFGGRRSAGGPAERFVAQKRERWAAFQELATDASTNGLDGLPPDQLIDFATRYREVAADLARARTYHVPASEQILLERAVAAGHNALYRREDQSWKRLSRFITADCPAAVVQGRWHVGLAFLCFTIPGALGFGLLRQRPTLAPEVVPEVMLERARAGVERQQQGKGYFEADADTRPLMAAGIIANNVRVAFYCFAGGLLAGVGSLVLLAVNGLSIGAASGHFANQGLLGYLWTFIAGHGLLELFAIWVAGAAGLLLGLAIIAPGQRTRRDALVIAGRRAVRMVGFSVILLLLAGLVEGLISASAVAPAGKLTVSVASAVFLIGYLAVGVRAAQPPTV